MTQERKPTVGKWFITENGTSHQQYINEQLAYERADKKKKSKRMTQRQETQLDILKDTCNLYGLDFDVMRMYQAFHRQTKDYDSAVEQIKEAISARLNYDS